MEIDYAGQVVELEKTLDEIISKIQSVGQDVDNKLKHSPADEIYIIARDTFKRLITNIQLLRQIKISEATCVSYRLIVRSMFADIIEAIYYLAVKKDTRDAQLKARNAEALRTLELYATETDEFYALVNPNDYNRIDIAILHNKFHDYVDLETGDFYSKKAFNEKFQVTKLNIHDMAENLVKCGFWTEHYKQLYTNYRLLSLTEHYSSVVRKFSYNQIEDICAYNLHFKWLLVGTDVLVNVVREWLDTGNFEITNKKES